MTTFALVTEGITDQAVLEALLVGYYKNQTEEEVYINPEQPVRDATDEARQGDFGGWEKVLEFCTFTDRINEILAFNDYLVIQIDTDCGEHDNFGVPLTEGGQDRAIPAVVGDTINKISRCLSPLVLAENSDRILFAIAVHSVECWLLPLYCAANHQKKIKSCHYHLADCLDKQNRPYTKDYQVYQNISKPFRKVKTLTAAAEHSESLSLFVKSLPKIVVD